MSQFTHDGSDDDLNDIMSKIMKGEERHSVPAAALPSKKSSARSRLTLKAGRHATRTHVQQPGKNVKNTAARSTAGVPAIGNNKSRSNRRTIRRTVLATTMILLIGVAAAGIYTLRDQASQLPSTPSPFSREFKSQTNFPLYFPTSLPASFRIDTGTIQMRDEGRIFYIASDNEGNAININLQKSAENVDPSKKLKYDTEPRKLKTDIGTATIFTKDGLQTAIIVGIDSWIFVNTKIDTVDERDFDALVKSFHEG